MFSRYVLWVHVMTRYDQVQYISKEIVSHNKNYK